ncbi:MAG TPA: YjbE family putative metal transport protein [Geminicoccaceae bacterium]|nr:YjbE family putative metal transport protein [Geminicoccaceae bacterium]
MLSESFISGLVAFGSVVVIDIVLAGDNALVVGLAASGLPAAQQRRVIALGIGIALVCRIAFAVIAVQLLAIIGLLLAGGLLLLWVAWKMWRDLRAMHHHHHGEKTVEGVPVEGPRNPHGGGQPKTFRSAVVQVAVADVSMSLDNVLAVAGAARDHIWLLIFGLALSIALMGVAAGFIARYMERYPWLSYIGLAVVTYVALSMIWHGAEEVLDAVNGA